MNIKVHKDYSDELIQKVFVEEGLGAVKNKEEFCEIFKAAKEKICLVCEDGLSTELLKALAMTSARKYVIVRELEEEKYQTLSELLIVREVSNISGNYAIIDGAKIIFFDKDLNFNLVSDVKVAQKASSLFIKEFWDNANFEYVGKKQVAAETTFDIAPIYSEGKFIIDDAFSGNVQTVLEQSTEAYYKGKAKIGTFEKICIKDIRNNEEVISNITHQELIYAPELSVDAVKNADSYFYLNFGVEGYSLSPEKQKNHYFAIGADSLNVGTKYKFYLKEKFANLVGKTCLDGKGNPLVVEENVVVSKNVSVDLNKERLILEATEDLREGMLQSIDSKIFDYEGFAKNVVFDIALNLKKKKFTQKAKIYTQYDQIVAGLEKFRKTSIEFCKQNDKKKFIEELEELSIKFTTVAEYETIAEKLKNIVENINSYDNVKKIVGNLPIHSLVVFVQNNTYHIEAKNVIPLSELKRTLCSGASVLTVKQMEKAYQLLLASKTEISTKEHVENIRAQQWNVEHGICPRCGGKLVLRNGKYGEFWGCSNYPRCKFIKKD